MATAGAARRPVGWPARPAPFAS